MDSPRPRTGVVTAQDLQRLGWSYNQRRAAVANGRLIPLRRGFYAGTAPHPGVAQIVRGGGVVACTTALKLHQIWVPPQTGLHQRRARPTVGDCPPYGPTVPVTEVVDPLPVAVRSAARCLSTENFVAVADSVLHLGRMSLSELRAELAHAPGRVRALIDLCDRSESGTESLTRLRLRARNIKVQPQVPIPGVGRVDFLIGRRLVLEVDSLAHHTNLEAYHNDRQRDRALVALGYLVMRITYHDVMYRWAEIEPAILAVIRRREHVRNPRPR